MHSRNNLSCNRKGLRRFLANGVALIFAMFFFLAASEAGYRLYVRIWKPLYRPSSVPGLGWEFTPGATNVPSGRRPGPCPYFINDHGFRDKANGRWQPWTDADVKMAMIGDSITAGADVGYAETYSAQTEGLLHRRGISARVVNWGLDATNSRQHLALMKAKALPLGPRGIVLGYCLNDTEKRFLETLPGPFQVLMRHFHLAVFLSQRLVQTFRNRQAAVTQKGAVKENRETSKTPACGGYTQSILASYETPAWAETAQSIAQMASLARQKGIDFGVVIFPFEEQVHGICPAFAQEKIKLFLALQGIPFLDLLESFQKAREEKLYVPGDPIHPNAKGHRLAAEAIVGWMDKKSLFPFSAEGYSTTARREGQKREN